MEIRPQRHFLLKFQPDFQSEFLTLFKIHENRNKKIAKIGA